MSEEAHNVEKTGTESSILGEVISYFVVRLQQKKMKLKVEVEANMHDHQSVQLVGTVMQ